MAFLETWPIFVPVEAPVRSSTEAVTTWVAARWTAIASCTIVVSVIGYVQAVNLASWPTLANDDEGTYMARAWAVQTGRGAHHSLANYTYWYDHAPLGWIQLVPWTWLTDAYRAGGEADIAGRRIMVGYALVSTLLVYIIARRLGCSKPVSLAAMALFGLSPVSVDYLHQIFLDCIGLPWILAAFALALSPKRHLWAFAASGACFAVAVLSKETYLLWAPALVYQVWQRADRRTRAMCLVAFSSVAAALLAVYPLYALLKGELFPGRGHVSLIGAIEWQLASRSSSGSAFSAASDAHAKVLGWYHDDRWLVGGGILALIPAAATRRLRPVAAGVLVPALYVMHGGYLPAMYVIGVLAFEALIIACSAQTLWRLDPLGRIATALRQSAVTGRVLGLRMRSHVRLSLAISWGRLAWRALLLAVLVPLSAEVVPAWGTADSATTYDVNTALFQSEQWVEQHVPKTDPVLVDANVWIDLVDDGAAPSKVVWFWELSADPDVGRRYPEGWRQMDYIVVTNTIRVNLLSEYSSVAPVAQAAAHSTLVVRFGTGTNFVEIRRIHPYSRTTSNPPWWLPGYGKLRPPTSGPEKGEQL